MVVSSSGAFSLNLFKVPALYECLSLFFSKDRRVLVVAIFLKLPSMFSMGVCFCSSLCLINFKTQLVTAFCNLLFHTVL